VSVDFEAMAVGMRRGAVARGYTGSEHATAEELREKFAELNNACVYCNRGDLKLSPDHDVPICRGGSNAITNVLPSCLPCNLHKRAWTSAEYRDHLAGVPTPRYRSRRHTAPRADEVEALADTAPLPTRRRSLTVDDVAAILAVSRGTVTQLVKRGHIRAVNLGIPGSRQTVRVFDDDLRSFLDSRRTAVQR
jgi:excisionase family DNA binding protein